MLDTEFHEFPKMARLSRECIVSEKIDGTNAQILIVPKAEVPAMPANPVCYDNSEFWIFAGSRTRWIHPTADNYGFAAWVRENGEQLLTLGPGRHFGEWWGAGIQRRYGLDEKRLSLFNVERWCLHGNPPCRITTNDPRVEKIQDVLPPCVGLVPILYRGEFSTIFVEQSLDYLRQNGSVAAPGFRQPEGVVVWHIAGNVGFKKTLEKDEQPKSKAL